jgi:hypothetical protein
MPNIKHQVVGGMRLTPNSKSRSGTRIAPSLALLSLAVLLGGNVSVQASPQVSASANAAYIGNEISSQTASSGGVSAVVDGLPHYDDRYGQASASSSFGVLRASSSIGVPPRGSSFYNAVSFSEASFRDDFLIDAPGLTGTQGSVTVRFTIDGSLSANAVGTPSYSAPGNATYARAGYTFGVNPNSGDSYTQRKHWDGSTSGTQFLGVEQVHTLYFTYGTTLENVTLRITTTNSAAGEGYSYYSATASDLSHTAIWGGFGEVRDAGGNIVENYSFSSASGTDYTQAVPEPATSLLAGLGLAFTLLRRRRAQG